MRIDLIIQLLIAAMSLGCGVRGAPVPPGAPAELGYGSPRYRDARNRISPPPVPNPSEVRKADTKEKKEDQK